MRVGDCEEFGQRRAEWLAQVAGGLVVRQVERTIKAAKVSPALSVTELALLSTATGLGHLLGLDDDDLALDGLLSTDEVVAVVSGVWRGGSVPGRWSAALVETYQTLFVCGRDTRTVRPALLEALAESPLNFRLSDYLPAYTLDPTPSSDVDDFCTLAVETHPDATVPELQDPVLDLSRSHLPLVAWLLSRLPDDARQLFTPLEVRMASPEAAVDTATADDVDQWCHLNFIELSLPGSWPSGAGDAVPAWVRDTVIERGARFFYASTGNVPGWFFTSENDDERRAFQAWTYRTGFSFRVDGRVIKLAFVLRYAEADDVPIWYRYPVDDLIRLRDLKALLAVGLIRVDHYSIDSDARLRHIQSFGTPIPQQLIMECRTALAELTVGQEARLQLGLTETVDVLHAMAIVDRNDLEGLDAFIQSQRAGTANETITSYRRMLEIVDAATQDAMRGAQVDERLVSEARDGLRDALSRTDRRSEPLNLALLGGRRAYLQLRLDQGSHFLHCFTAHVDNNGRPDTHQFEFSDTINLRALPEDIEGRVSALADGLVELQTLRSHGVEAIVLRTSPGLYGVPWHEPLLRIGFSEVSYAHRLNSLAPSTPTLSMPTRAVVRGFAGSGTTELAAMPTELKSVASMYASWSDSSGIPPDVVHLSGHAVTGGTPYSIAIHDEPNRTLSSARVLLDWRLAGTLLVVLSACSTGTVDVALDQVLEVIPLDVAFIGAGAAAVISTCAPVNDTIAAVFACVLHHELASGAGVWNSYARARRVARGDAPDEVLATWLDEQWPSWTDELNRALVAAPHDWQLFRLMGRFW